MLVSLPALDNTASTLADSRDKPAIAAARRLVVSLLASIGANDLEKHAAVFKAFEVRHLA